MTKDQLEQVWRKFYAITGLCDAADAVAGCATQQDRETLAGCLIAIQELARQGELLVGNDRETLQVPAQEQSIGMVRR